MSSNIFLISGMSCGHCLNAVNRALATVDGVKVVSVQIGRAEVEARDSAALGEARTAIENAGYKVERSA